MLQLLCMIPEEIGWQICGFFEAILAGAFYVMVRLIVSYIKDSIELEKREEKSH